MKTPTKPKKAKQGKAATPPKRRGLLPRQERFCELIVSGMSGVDAWLAAGYKVSRDVARANAAESLANPIVAARIAELRKPQTAESLLTKDAKRRFYFEVVNDPAAKMADRLRASELDAKMAGHFEPDRLAVDSGPALLESIRERASAVASALDRNGRQRQQEAAPAAVPGLTAGPASGNGHVGALSRWVPPAPD